ncbi:MAG: hypothetical protein LBO69_03015 [Ignavibacteria bacterium]|jgi:outer membrane lipoprotein-sorting protein|nr:hypothetical protein [Ignavibacteria bacterium]
MKKIFFILPVLMLMALISSSCSKETAEQISTLKNIAENVQDMSSEENAKSKEELEKLMQNYSITLQATNAKGQTETLVEQKNSKGYLVDSKDGVVYFDLEGKKFYTLKKTDMSGVAMPMKDSTMDLTGLAGFTGVAAYLYVFEMYRMLGAKKDGTGSVAGRSAITYIFDKDGTNVKMWIDKEWGICLKYEITEKGETKKMEITSISFGNANINVDLSKYKISDMGSMLGNMK